MEEKVQISKIMRVNISSYVSAIQSYTNLLHLLLNPGHAAYYFTRQKELQLTSRTSLMCDNDFSQFCTELKKGPTNLEADIPWSCIAWSSRT